MELAFHQATPGVPAQHQILQQLKHTDGCFFECGTLAGMKSLACLASCCFLAIASYAQETTALPIIVAGATQSSIPVRVSDFKVEVNNEPVSVASLTSLSGKPLQYVLINDQRLHNQWPGGRDQQAHVAKELLKQVVSSGSDIGTLVNYSDAVFLDVQDERDPKKLSSQIRATGIGPARLYEAVVAGTKWLAKQPTTRDGRKVTFLVCDGSDTGSHVGLADAIKALQEASFPIFVVAPSDSEKKKQGQDMRELAEQSGGRAYFLGPSTRYLTFDDLKRDLADSFLLALNPPFHNKGFLPLRITGVAHPQLSISSSTRVFVP